MNNKIEDIINIYEIFLRKNNIYTDELFNYGVKAFKTNGVNCNRNLQPIYRNEWRDFYIRHSVVYKMFLRYLKENNIYYKFFKKLEKNHLFFTKDFIISSFDWASSNEGTSYWNNKSEEWNKLLSEIEK